MSLLDCRHIREVTKSPREVDRAAERRFLVCMIAIVLQYVLSLLCGIGSLAAFANARPGPRSGPMPEGPEIRRAADRVFAAVGGVPVEVVFHLPALTPWNELFDNTRVERIETRGKAMLTWLAGGYVIYSHNQLYGRWEVLRTGKTSRTRRSLRLEIRSASHAARLLSATDIMVLHEDELHEHPFLASLGPDALDLAVTSAMLRTRLRDKAWKNKRLASLYLDQSFVAGIGNYLRSEILYVSRVDPLQRASTLTAEQIRTLAEQTLSITRRSLATGGVTLDEKLSKSLTKQGVSRRQRRHYVFGRAGQPCFRCETIIERIEVAARAVFVCPSCQGMSAAVSQRSSRPRERRDVWPRALGARDQDAAWRAACGLPSRGP